MSSTDGACMTSARSGDVPAGIIAALLIALALAPLMVVRIPAMVDYPNHLARMYILLRDGTPAANPYYQVHWALYPNLAIDLVVPLLARWLGVESAMRLFLFVSQALIVSGAVLLERVVKGCLGFAIFDA